MKYNHIPKFHRRYWKPNFLNAYLIFKQGEALPFECLLEYFSWIFQCCLLIYFKIIFFFKKVFREYNQDVNSLGPDQARHLVGPDLGPNCL